MNSAGEWAEMPSEREQIATLKATVKRLTEENEMLRTVMRGIASTATMTLEGKPPLRNGARVSI